jgi:hypothetical protein
MNENKIKYPLKTCPWCNATAKFHMNCKEKTWLAIIHCPNSQCMVMPKTRYVPIRKNQRRDAAIIRQKVEKVIKYWNDGNLSFKNEGFELDFDKIVEDYKTGNIGLPGYNQA